MVLTLPVTERNLRPTRAGRALTDMVAVDVREVVEVEVEVVVTVLLSTQCQPLY